MTDAAISLTQSVVEQFTDQYLRSLGCTIEKDGSTWDVTVPDDAETELPTGNVTVRCGGDDSDPEPEENIETVHPESEFFQQILAEASTCTLSGKVTIESENTELRLPVWLRKSDVGVGEAHFTPYYDRTAIIVLFRVSIETVSEYQKELLRAVAIDARSGEPLPGLEDVFVRETSVESGSAETDRAEIESEKIAALIDSSADLLVDRIQPQIDEIHREASRAADAEVEEYRRMQEQRIDELEEQLSTLSSQIRDLNVMIDNNGGENRIRTLKDRKERSEEFNNVEEELSQIRKRREQGFPEKQRDIRKRHALDVVVSPRTLTQLEYERGEIQIEVQGKTTTRNMNIGYGLGIGVTEQVHCETCHRSYSDKNSLRISGDELRCDVCVSSPTV